MAGTTHTALRIFIPFGTMTSRTSQGSTANLGYVQGLYPHPRISGFNGVESIESAPQMSLRSTQ